MCYLWNSIRLTAATTTIVFFITDVYDSLVIDSTKTIIPLFLKISQYIAAMSKLIKMWSSMSNMSPRKFTCQCNTCHWILKQVSLPPCQILSHGRGMGGRGRRTSSDDQRVAVRIKCRHLCGAAGGAIMGIWPRAYPAIPGRLDFARTNYLECSVWPVDAGCF